MPKEAKQFDGTFGNAKAMVAWIGEDRACAGATWGHTDDQEGGLNLVEQRDGAPFYTDVPATAWVVKDDEGAFVIFTAEQFKLAFPSGV